MGSVNTDNFYLLVAYLFWRIYQLKEYSDVNDPYEVKKIIQRTPEVAYESLYKQVEQAYSDNKKINEGKSEISNACC